MKDAIKQEHEKIKDKITYNDFLKRIEEMKKDYEDVTFMDDLDIARMIVGEFIDEKNTPLTELEENKKYKISNLEAGMHNLSLTGRVMRISNVKKFTTRKGREGKVANLMFADDTGEIRVVLWTDNIKLLKKISEGYIIKINNVEVKEGFKDKEIHLQRRSTIEKLPEEGFEAFPKYKEKITNIADIKDESQMVNLIARIVRIPRIRNFERNGREGKVASLELQDKTGSISFTLWNRDVDLIDELDLGEGDSVKILGALSRSRNGEMNLTHSWIGRIIKGDFDVPEYEEKILKIGDAHEIRDVTVMGVVSKIHDSISFERADGTTGTVRSIVIADETGTIRVTLWNEDADIKIKKGDILKITGGNIEFDEFSDTGYRINTNWSSRIIINPDSDESLRQVLEEYKKHLKPVKIGDIDEIEDEGEEIDIVGRIISINEPREFQRSDGTVGVVRSAEIADETGVVRTSFWDDKTNVGLNIGDAVRIENARTRIGLENIELSIGKTSRIMDPKAEDLKDLPSFDKLEEMVYKTKKIDEIEEDDRNIRLIGRIIDIYEPNEFQRSDGTVGVVRSAEIADETGVVRTSFWDDKAKIVLDIGDPIKIENPRARFRADRIELSIGRTTQITKPAKKDLKGLPTFKELEEMIYKPKKIEKVEEEDRNIKISGEIIGAYGERILYPMCPECNKKLEYVDDAYICDFCGEEIEEPNYLMIIPCEIEDDTGSMRVTFFRKQAEKLIGMDTQKANEVISKTADEGSLAEKVEDLIGNDITIIADANFDEYNEEIRLIAKKIVNI
ncbi:MAG: replication protein A [Euryarchaeota archaeon]|nr:replication protein A [Euryarchaeota archaeon]